ncbi:tetratricopeptide repeat protein [Halalkalibacillus halophilus]|uniref:tetratricopeptide repeat protein n=1 Tax=Halalkalibacillus halophilus TaxID=392827 RepID=UPI0003FFBDB8|nr:tetratricopeptide repeat protein [Halalkalibacillus halophilus]
MNYLENILKFKENSQWEDAQKLILEVLEQEQNSEVYFHAGDIHEKLEMFPQAITYYKQALEEAENLDLREEILLSLGRSYRSVGLYDLAVETLEIGMSEFPTNNKMSVYFAMALYNQGDPDLAMEIIIQKLLETTQDQSLKEEQELIEFYASCLDETFS